MGDVSETGCNSLLLGLLPLRFYALLSICPYIPFFLHPQPWTSLYHSPLPKEKSKWEGKQNSLKSELTELHETVASLQSRLRQAELQGIEAQVSRHWFGGGDFFWNSPGGRAPSCSSRPTLASGHTSSICSAQLPSARVSISLDISVALRAIFKAPMNPPPVSFSELMSKFLFLALKDQSQGWLIGIQLFPLDLAEP